MIRTDTRKQMIFAERESHFYFRALKLRDIKISIFTSYFKMYRYKYTYTHLKSSVQLVF